MALPEVYNHTVSSWLAKGVRDHEVDPLNKRLANMLSLLFNTRRRKRTLSFSISPYCGNTYHEEGVYGLYGWLEPEDEWSVLAGQQMRVNHGRIGSYADAKAFYDLLPDWMPVEFRPHESDHVDIDKATAHLPEDD